MASLDFYVLFQLFFFLHSACEVGDLKSGSSAISWPHSVGLVVLLTMIVLGGAFSMMYGGRRVALYGCVTSQSWVSEGLPHR